MMDRIISSLIDFRAFANSFLSNYEPLALLLAPLLTLFTARILQSLFLLVHDNGLKPTILGFLITSIKMVPGVMGYIDAEKQKVVEKLQSESKSKRDGWRSELPSEDLGAAVIEKLKQEKSNDVVWQGKCSGTVFAHTNPLHLDVFQTVAQCEAEVVALTAALLGSKNKSSGGEICGNMTSVGTESILLAVKSSRDYMKAKKGIKRPEMIIPESAHSAYDKAAQYFNIKLQRVPVNKDFQADVKAIRQHINKNTVLIVGSAPGFPHGIIDPIEELGELAYSYGICFHVDLCLGGFVLSFARKLGVTVDNASSRKATLIKVDSANKRGSLLEVAQVLTDSNLLIRRAYISSDGEWFMDVFHVTDQHGNKLSEDDVAERIQQNLVLKVDVQDQKTMTRINKTAVSLSGIRIFYSMLILILKKKTCMCNKWFDNNKKNGMTHQ